MVNLTLTDKVSQKNVPARRQPKVQVVIPAGYEVYFGHGVKRINRTTLEVFSGHSGRRYFLTQRPTHLVGCCCDASWYGYGCSHLWAGEAFVLRERQARFRMTADPSTPWELFDEDETG
jgi:hypothetical protein